MPLLDHFHPPLSSRRHWHSFHHAWATYLAADLNERLPQNYFAEANAQDGIEIDVAAQQESPDGTPIASWSPPTGPTLTLPMALLSDLVEVQVFNQEGGPVLAGAMELVSPANKDRPESRDAFVSKCASYLHEGIGLVMVDVVTERNADLHGELIHRIHRDHGNGKSSPLWTAAYRPTKGSTSNQLEIWHVSLAIGARLPEMPLWLKNGPCVKADLEAAYQRTCREHRIA